MATNRNGKVPILAIKKGDSLKTIYAKARRAFTAADLQKYTEIEEGIPLEQIIAELEAIQNKPTKRHKSKARKKRPSSKAELGKRTIENEGTIMASNRNGKVPILRIKKGNSLKTIYAKYRRAFTAADLQKYTEI